MKAAADASEEKNLDDEPDELEGDPCTPPKPKKEKNEEKEEKKVKQGRSCCCQ